MLSSATDGTEAQLVGQVVQHKFDDGKEGVAYGHSISSEAVG